VATAPATVVCGSDARLWSASPSPSSTRARSPYFSAPAIVTWPSPTVTSDGSASSDTSSSESAMSLNVCRVPSTRIRCAPATISRNCSIVSGRCSVRAR
jgi:hypothetical protein